MPTISVMTGYVFERDMHLRIDMRYKQSGFLAP